MSSDMKRFDQVKVGDVIQDLSLFAVCGNSYRKVVAIEDNGDGTFNVDCVPWPPMRKTVELGRALPMIMDPDWVMEREIRCFSERHLSANVRQRDADRS